MKRPVLFAFMVLCAVFWTVMAFTPVVNSPKDYVQAVADHEKSPTEQTAEALKIAKINRESLQFTVWGLAVVSWVGVGVMLMVKRTQKPVIPTA
jgi:hypothetical protein